MKNGTNLDVINHKTFYWTTVIQTLHKRILTLRILNTDTLQDFQINVCKTY